jgi:hypothetical protein
MTSRDKIIEDFIRLAEQHGQSLRDGNGKTANKIHSSLTKRIDQIKQLTEPERQSFYDLLDYDNGSVKLWTAVALSGTFPEKTLDVLTRIADTNDILGLTAKATIDMINKKMIDKENWINKS